MAWETRPAQHVDGRPRPPPASAQPADEAAKAGRENPALRRFAEPGVAVAGDELLAFVLDGAGKLQDGHGLIVALDGVAKKWQNHHCAK